MKFQLHILIIILVVINVITSKAQSFKVMTLNIRYDEKNDSLDNWHLRKKEMLNFFNKEKPLVLGIQEGLYHQVTYIESNLKDYIFVGLGRDDGDKKGEYSAIFIDTTILEIIQSSTFWLSDKPDIVSIGWDAALPRVCTYALLKFKNKNRFFWIFNTHFDHKGIMARVQSAELIIQYIKTQNTQNYPVVLMGDLNTKPVEAPVKLLSEKFFDVRKCRNFNGSESTFNGFGMEKSIKRIDYIFLSGFEAQKAEHINVKRSNGRYISDHIPVMAKLKFL